MKKTSLLLILLLSLFVPNFANAYPPDNAAVLYYKNMERFEKPDEAIFDELRSLDTSSEPASEEVKAFIQKQKDNHLIPELQIASELEHCDWGLDFSQGCEMQLPWLSGMRNFCFLLLADAAIDSSKGNIETALDKNLAVCRMGHHVSNDTLIQFLVSLAMNLKSHEALGHLLSTYPIDEKTLTEFKNELLWETYQPKSIKHPFMMEKELYLLEISMMTPERFKKVFGGDWNGEQVEVNQEPDKQDKQFLRILKLLEKNDPTFLDRSAIYCEKYYDSIFTIMDNPYTLAYVEIGDALKKAEKIAENNDDALLTATLCPNLEKCYSFEINWKTDYDATLTALDVYIIAAKTGKLPPKLPRTTYIDHFSGKPFIYEITNDGFTLRCQQEDLSKKTTHEFTYKLPK